MPILRNWLQFLKYVVSFTSCQYQRVEMKYLPQYYADEKGKNYTEVCIRIVGIERNSTVLHEHHHIINMLKKMASM